MPARNRGEPRSRTLTLLSLAAGNLLLPACVRAGDLAGTRWRLEDLAGRGVVQGVEATLEFTEPGYAAGNGWCNQFRGPVTVSGETIRFGALMSTKRACVDEAANAQETEYLAELLTRNEQDLRTLARNTPTLLGGIAASADAVAALRDLLYANLRMTEQAGETERLKGIAYDQGRVDRINGRDLYPDLYAQDPILLAEYHRGYANALT